MSQSNITQILGCLNPKFIGHRNRTPLIVFPHKIHPNSVGKTNEQHVGPVPGGRESSATAADSTARCHPANPPVRWAEHLIYPAILTTSWAKRCGKWSIYKG